MVQGRLEIPLEKSGARGFLNNGARGFQKNGARGFQKNGARVPPYTTHKVHSTLGGRKDGRTEGRTDGRTESQKICPSAFLRKGGGQ